jgi:hypothetical protein
MAGPGRRIARRKDGLIDLQTPRPQDTGTPHRESKFTISDMKRDWRLVYPQ